MPNENVTEMRWVPFTIAAGNRDSEPINCNGRGIAKVVVIGAWTTSALTFLEQINADNAAADTDYKECYLDDGSLLGVASGNMIAGRIIFLSPDGAGVGFKHKIKVHSSNTQAAGCRGYVLLRGY